jgi:hypothetical protein
MKTFFAATVTQPGDRICHLYLPWTIGLAAPTDSARQTFEAYVREPQPRSSRHSRGRPPRRVIERCRVARPRPKRMRLPPANQKRTARATSAGDGSCEVASLRMLSMESCCEIGHTFR